MTRSAPACVPAWEEVARLYQDLARSAVAGRSPAAVRALRSDALRLLVDLRGRGVLEVGCKSGAFARRLAEAGARVLGVDASVESIDEARADAAAIDAGEVPVFAVADPADAATWPEGSFDVVVWLDLERPPPELRALVRKLRRGGRLVLATPHPYGPDKPIGRPLESLMRWLREAGLRMIDTAEPTSRAVRDYLVILAERPARRPRRR